jgi:DNA-binding transcriptional LysR family regulator
LKVAATPQTIDGVLSTFLARYAERRPNVQIKLTEAFGTELVTKLDRGDVHIIVTTAGAIEANRSSFETIWLPPLEFVAAFGPALDYEKADSIDVGKLGSHPLLLLNTSFAVRVAFDAACRVADFQPNVAFESRTPHTLLALAEAGHGIAVVPSVLPTHRYNLRIVRLTYRRKPLQEAYAVVFDRRRSLPPAGHDFCASLVSYVREVFPISRPFKAAARRVAPRKGQMA